jgi:hypothetical protein
MKHHIRELLAVQVLAGYVDTKTLDNILECIVNPRDREAVKQRFFGRLSFRQIGGDAVTGVRAGQINSRGLKSFEDGLTPSGILRYIMPRMLHDYARDLEERLAQSTDALAQSKRELQSQQWLIEQYREKYGKLELTEESTYNEPENGVDEHLQQLLATKLIEIKDAVGMLTQTYNRLSYWNVESIGELTQKNEHELLDISGFGRKSLSDVKEILAGMGLKLKESN